MNNQATDSEKKPAPTEESVIAKDKTEESTGKKSGGSGADGFAEGKTTEGTEEGSEDTAKKKGKGKLLIVLILTFVLAGGAGTGIFLVWRSAGYLTTDNATVRTTLIAITADIPGPLQRFTIYQGRYVEENEVLGWVQNGEAFRAPFNGLVVQSSAQQDQIVSPMEHLAVIANIDDLHIQANIRETDIAKLQVGQPAIITIDPFGNRQFNGYISEIGMVTAAELTGQSMFFNTGGTFTRVTHLIPIKINVTDDVNLDHFIGVNARVRIPLR